MDSLYHSRIEIEKYHYETGLKIFQLRAERDVTGFGWWGKLGNRAA